MEIALLADHAEAIDALAAWYTQEWEPYYGARGPGDAAADLASRCNRDQPPLGLVAIEGGSIIGTVAIDRDGATGLTPSIVGLLVASEYRRKGVASMLLDAAERVARDLGYDELFMSTTILGEMLVRKGWIEKGEVRFLNDETGKLYSRSLFA